MRDFIQWFNEGVLTNIDSIAMQIQGGTLPPATVKQYLQQMIASLDQGQEDDPFFLHLATTIQDDIIPVISTNPMFSQETSQLQALTSAYTQ